nr:retrotransposon protein, putative, Ty1-copia subclass [Tanacetum cinerariifolium]
MKDNEVWVLVELPPNGKTVGSKWLFKKKTDIDGVVHTYKAHLVVKGYTQTPRIDYEETFSPVADIRAIRILIAIAADRSRRLIGLCQSAYIKKILKRYCIEISKRGSIPIQEKLKLSKSQGASTHAELKRMQNVPYALAVGSIMYAVRCTHPDVAFAQNVTSRFQHNPGDLHWTTVKNILKYFRNTKDMFLVYGGDLKRELRVSCYTDAGYMTDADDLKSQTGYVFVLNGGAVDWKSAKQRIFATSSAEAEYISAFDASKEVVWVRKFISGLGVVPTIEEPIKDKIMGRGKNKQAYAPKPKIPPPPKREDTAKDSICHECGETGHWKRNCRQYLAELLEKKKNATSRAGGSGIFVIELNTILNRSWIYDTGCGTH